MKKKIISAFIAASMSLAVVPHLCFAADADSPSIRLTCAQSSNCECGHVYEYGTVDEFIKDSLTYEKIKCLGYKIDVLEDISIDIKSLTDLGFSAYEAAAIEEELWISHSQIVMQAGLDLNGHTLIINNKYNANAQYPGLSTTHSSEAIIKNGTIELGSNTVAADIIGNVTLENVTIKVADGASEASSIKFTQDNTSSVVTLKNCVIDVNATPFTTAGNTIIVESGSYKGLDADTLSGGVMLASGSKSTNVTGIADGTTVITSPTTAAIVVKDGMAYTYDDVEDAKAAQADGKLLVKNEQGVFAEEAKKVTWVTATDSGVYTADQAEADRKGMVRFLFNADIAETDIKESGIKCVSGDNITEAPEGSLLIGNSGTARVFYADITEIPTDNSGTFYAIAYVTDKNNNTYWSQPVSAAVDTSRVFTSID